VFATMSNVSTISDRSSKFRGTRSARGTFASNKGTSSSTPNPLVSSPVKNHKLEEMFIKPAKPADVFVDMEAAERSGTYGNSGSGNDSGSGNGNGNGNTNSKSNNSCSGACNCPHHGRRGSGAGLGYGLGQKMISSTSKRRSQKITLETLRGYPSGSCVSSAPPEYTNWDEKEAEDAGIPLMQTQSTAKNTAINLEAMKAFLNSPLFSNILKTLTIMTAVSLFAIALDAIVILLKAPSDEAQYMSDNAALILVVILSLLTILYSSFNIFLESRRPPEGLDTSNSKPLTVIFSEIIASVVWAQVLSITIYIYIWTYGCTAAGQQHLTRLWKMDVADHRFSGKMCRRQGAMVGLEVLLVLLLIFNVYTHLAQNFKFIRAVS